MVIISLTIMISAKGEYTMEIKLFGSAIWKGTVSLERRSYVDRNKPPPNQEISVQLS